MADIAGMIAEAERLCQGQRFDEADRCYADVLKVDPCHVDALFQRARLAAMQGRVAYARAMLEAILTVAPDHVAACPGPRGGRPAHRHGDGHGTMDAPIADFPYVLAAASRALDGFDGITGVELALSSTGLNRFRNT